MKKLSFFHTSICLPICLLPQDLYGFVFCPGVFLDGSEEDGLVYQLVGIS